MFSGRGGRRGPESARGAPQAVRGEEEQEGRAHRQVFGAAGLQTLGRRDGHGSHGEERPHHPNGRPPLGGRCVKFLVNFVGIFEF